MYDFLKLLNDFQFNLLISVIKLSSTPVRISRNGYTELADNKIKVREVVC
jgi:hypothetical protein